MITRNQTWRDAESIAEDALFELRDPRRGPRLQMATERIEEILLEYKGRTRTETEYTRWLKCVRQAAMEMARSGQLPGGARLSMWSERRLARW